MIFSRLFSNGGALPDTGEISHDDLVAAVKAKTCHVIDVREPSEYAAGHVPGAKNHPLSRFDAKQLPSGKPVVQIRRALCNGAEQGACRGAHGCASLSRRNDGVATKRWRPRGLAIRPPFFLAGRRHRSRARHCSIGIMGCGEDRRRVVAPKRIEDDLRPAMRVDERAFAQSAGAWKTRYTSLSA